MAHAEYNASSLDDLFDLDAFFDAGSHWLLAQNVIALICKCMSNLEMHTILDCNNHSICETLSGGSQCFG